MGNKLIELVAWYNVMCKDILFAKEPENGTWELIKIGADEGRILKHVV